MSEFDQSLANEITCHLEEGFRLMIARDHEASLAEFHEAMRLDPQQAQPYYYVGYILSDKRQDDDALRFLRRASELDPSDAPTHRAMAVIYGRKGDKEAEAAALKAAVQCPQSPAERHKSLAGESTAQGRYEEALEYYRAAAVAEPGDVYLPGLIGYTLHLMGRYSEARTFMVKATSAPSALPEEFINLGLTEVQLGNDQAAKAAFEAGLRLNPHYQKGWRNLWRVEYRLGDLVSACRHFLRSISCTPGSGPSDW